jgi:hypothetical protein
VFADATFLVQALGPRSKENVVRELAKRINVVLHQQSMVTTDGTVIQCIEESAGALPAFVEDGVPYARRGGKYNVWVQA